MKTIIAGSRTCHSYADLLEAIAVAELVGIVPTTVLSGLSVGVDQLGMRWAGSKGLPIERCAGMDAAENMVRQADALIAVWHNRSRETHRLIERAEKRGLQVCVWEV